MRGDRWRRWAAACALALVASGALPVPEARAARASVPAQASAAEWTVLVYLDADNNLEATALIDLEEMARAAGANVNFLVLIDRNTKDQGSPEAPDGEVVGLPAFSDAKLLKLDADGVEVLQELGEIDLMDPQNLSWFVWYGLTEYPAEHTGLVFWDHGGAALYPFGEDADSAPADYFTLPELQQALGSAAQAAGTDRLDFIGWDVCLNATIEVARSMAPYAEVMVASEEIVAGHGWDYTALALLQEPGTDAKELASAVVTSFEAHSISSPLGGESDYTQSAIDLDAIEAVDLALAGFVSAVEDDPANGLALLQARQGAMEFGVAGPDPGGNFHQVDLGDLLARLPSSLPDDVLVARNALVAAVDRAVLSTVSGPAHAAASGLAIQLPSSGSYYASEYEEHQDPTGWRELVKSILSGESTPAGTDAPEASGDLELEAEAEAAGWRATMHLAEGAGATLAGGVGIFGSPGDDGTALALTVLPATLGAGDPDDLQTSWGYDFVRLAGRPVTAQIEPLEQGFRASVGGVYVDPSGTQTEATLRLELIPSGSDLEVGEVSLLTTSGNGVGAIYPAEGSRFAASRLTVSGAEVVATDLNEPFDPLDFAVAFDALAPGDRFYASLIAYLPDGSSAVRSAVAARP